MNWFFHKRLLDRLDLPPPQAPPQPAGSAAGATSLRATILGLGLLGFTSVYREGFEIVIFLQDLRERFGSSVVLEGVVSACCSRPPSGVLTFGLHQRLPYKRLLIITGAMLVVVLFVMVGEEVNEMQLAGWIGTTPIPGSTSPAGLGTWFSIFPNVRRSSPRWRRWRRPRLLRRRPVRARLAPSPAGRAGGPPRRGSAERYPRAWNVSDRAAHVHRGQREPGQRAPRGGCRGPRSCGSGRERRPA